MKKTYHRVVLLSVLGIALSVFSSGCVSQREARIERFQEKKDDRTVQQIAGELNLSAEQEKVLSEVRGNILEEIRKASILSPEEKTTLRAAVTAYPIDSETVMRIREAHQDDILVLRRSVITEFERFRAVLTSEQRAKLVALTEQRMNNYTMME